MRSLSEVSAATPSWELPTLLSAGENTQIEKRPGTTATIPPPTPLYLAAHFERETTGFVVHAAGC